VQLLGVYVDVSDGADVVHSLTDGTTVEYVEAAAVKPEHVVVGIDKKPLEIPTGTYNWQLCCFLIMYMKNW